MGAYVALLRGINVGKAKRVAMADLRELVESLGATSVRTVLNSGNVCFRAKKQNPTALAAKLREALKDRLGVECSVLILDAQVYRRILRENPLTQAGEDPARFLVVFVTSTGALDPVRACLPRVVPPDRLAVGELAAYVWCASGVLDSPVSKLVTRVGGDTITARNWSTAQRVLAALETGESDEA